MKDISQLFLIMFWIAGIVAAKGWLTLLAIFFPPYAWYAFIDLVMTKLGLV